MKKIKYVVLIPLCSMLFSCSGTENSSTSEEAETLNVRIDYVYDKDEQGNDLLNHKCTLIVEDSSGQHTFNMDNCIMNDDVINQADIDGDGKNEIIVNQLAGMTGGAGSYISYVFDYENGEITKMFSSSSDNQFDTGFSSKLKDNSIVEFSNAFTGFTTEIDFYRNSHLFNEDGTVIEGMNDSDWAMFDSFREFVPEDIDSDGVYEISCLQFTSIDSHVQYVGDAQSYLKYNNDSKQFEVVKADFIPHNGNEDKIEFS